eukprot:g3999.t1
MIVRLAMGAGPRWTDAGPGLSKQLTKTAIRVGMYSLMDWHIEGGGSYAPSARNFWLDFTSVFGRYPNALYETWNEPKGWENPWPSQVKPWHAQMIAAIRQNSDNIITLGSPVWSSQPQLGVPDICHGAWAATKNIQMTVHEYSASNQGAYNGHTNNALNPMKGCGRGGLFMSEWGTCESSGDGRVDIGSANQWATWAHQESIAMCNWALNNKAESCSAIIPGRWTLDPGNLSQSGNHVLNTLIWAYNVKWFGKKGATGDYNLRCHQVKCADGKYHEKCPP